MFAGHEAFFYISQLQIVQGQHVLLFFLLIKENKHTNNDNPAQIWIQYTVCVKI